MLISTARRRTALALAAMVSLGSAIGACTNTIEGAEKDSRKIFKSEGGSPTTGQNPTPSNAKGGGWTNPQ